MRANREPTLSLRDEDLIELFSRRLPDLLERRPDLQPALFHAFLKTFSRREEVALVLTELRALRTEMESRFDRVDQRLDGMDQRFDRIDQRFDRLDQRFDRADQRFEQFRAEVAERFEDTQRSIDRLGSRWGIRNESLFRRTIAALIEKSFGVGVEQRTIAGEQFDVVIHDHQHVLVEVAASVGRTIQSRLERKRRLYEESTGVRPARIILATAWIQSTRAHQLRKAGIEVIEPEELDDSQE